MKKTYPVGHFNVEIETFGTGPFEAVGFIQPQRTNEPLDRIVAKGATAQEAVEAALEKASVASAGLWLAGKNRRHID
ncbi:hypothetical protein DFO63_4357 [Stenotrophomonas sp. AG209]|uniref:hypothetical protein n=1 Tax=Stenotrophomonas sp. AG209 TaxID=2183909 RepID=UPI000E5B2211|nr:hypothetical protein [Stenotrophomonas sp. AG209]RIA19233.1 hypothetical protein DFO63_4357 [Stenotrophomonas sp. AG209]